MQLVRLNKHSFIRKYENIGYLYNQLSRNEMVFDDIGAEFLLNIKRHPVSIDEIAKKMKDKFLGVTERELKNDFMQFVIELEKEGFVAIGEDRATLNKKEMLFLYKKQQSIHPQGKNQNNKIRESKDYLKKHFKNYPRLFRAHIELTAQCNLKCIHCYLPLDSSEKEMSKKIIFNFLDQLVSMGTLEVIFTGGEALLHKDLLKILFYAREKDFSLTLLTNGTLLDNETIKELKKINMALVQVSLYSMEPTIHDKITGITGSWQKTKNSLDTLIFNNIKVEIACPIIKENANSFQRVTEYGNGIGISVTNDLAIMAREDFSRDNLNHRVDIADIKKIVNCRNQYREALGDDKNTSRKDCPNEPICGMGLSLMCLSANGDYHPCPGFKISLGNIYQNTVKDVWEKSDKIKFLRKITNASFKKCMECEYLDYCAICPAKFYNESRGDIFKIDEYFCEIAKTEKEFYELEI